jgi:hypothetical protein
VVMTELGHSTHAAKSHHAQEQRGQTACPFVRSAAGCTAIFFAHTFLQVDKVMEEEANHFALA